MRDRDQGSGRRESAADLIMPGGSLLESHIQEINRKKLLQINGSPGRARTADLVINSHPLYRLSYRGITSGKSYWMGRLAVNVKPRLVCRAFISILLAYRRTG